MAMTEKASADRGYSTAGGVQGYDALAQANMNSLGTKLSTARKESPVNTVRAALKQSQELSNYVHSLVNQLCGSQPEETGYGTETGPSNGILFDVECEAHEASRSMQGAMNALRRLESHLP
jgi:hypothetical protein